MFRIIRVPPALDHFFHPLQPHFHWGHFAYFRLLVLVIAFAWGGARSPASTGISMPSTTGPASTTSS